MRRKRNASKNGKLTLVTEIILHKRSVIHKLERVSKTIQLFKNYVYLCASEYFKNTKNIKPFLSHFFLDSFVKGKKSLDYENENIKYYKKQLFKLWKEYLGSDTVKAITKQLSEEFASVIAKWKNNKKASLPKPKSPNSIYKFTLITNKNMIVDKRTAKRKPENSIVIRLGKAYGAVKIKLPKWFVPEFRDIKLTWIKDTEVIVKISYTINVGNFNPDKNKWLSIDVGIVNLISAVSNVEKLRSFIINGNPIKSFNQWINKKSAELQSKNDLKEFRQLWRYRVRRIKSVFHRISGWIIEICIKYNIGTIILPTGLNEEYQTKSKKSKKFNQEFRFIPIYKLLKMIEYKAKIFGIKVIYEPETYTSKISSITGNIESIQHKSKNELTDKDYENLKFTGKRIKRGLFKDFILNKVFNADLNGALNIAIKALDSSVRKQFLQLKNWLDKLSRPMKVFSESQLYKVAIGDSIAYPFT